MKSLELKPNKEILEKNIIGRNTEIINFIRLLDSIKSNFSIAIDNDWGTGKTFFVKQVKIILDAYNEHSYDYELSNLERIKNVIDIKNIDLHLAVYYNAWENDNQKSPLLSLIYEIIKVAKIDTNKTDISINKEKIIKDGLSAIVKHFSGIDIKELLKCVETEAKDIFKEIKGQKSTKEQVDNILNNLLLEHGERLVIFIDELDRCRPTFAVELLEQIKHYFDNDKITFVFSTNIKQLQYTIKKYYGEAFEAKRYLDKFFDLTVSLNEVNVIEYFNFVNEDLRDDMYDYVCKEIVKEYNFTLRDIIKFTQINKICIENLRKNQNKYLYLNKSCNIYILISILSIMIGLKIKRYDQYEDFITGKDSTPLIIILSKSGWIAYGIDKLLDEKEKSSKDINTIKEKLESMYKAIFIEKYRDKHSIKIGELEFTKETRKILFEAEGLLSRFARYN
ncbi:KAP family P-loop NTPase fold protein [Megamonas funiformis]|uniref:KAP family P-loop NTPase fold protein n=1 Tax=Megamonas funiformis TaxID=437897 RepID=UPI0026710445|nr:P-loop NTPase fold protein [Megamonas funiformis]